MRAIACILTCSVVCACAADTADITSYLSPLPPLITGDTCTPASSSTYLSCAEAVAASGASGCFTILSHGFAVQPVARNCVLEHVLVIQAYDGTAQPSTDQAYLDTVLDSLTTFIDAASYGRAVLDLEIAGDLHLATGARWFPSAATPSDQLDEIPASRRLHSLDYYDSFILLSTAADRSEKTTCTFEVDGTTFDRPCATTYRYRATSDPTAAADTGHHEFGHALGLGHDHSFSSVAGYGAVRSAFEGEVQEYGGCSSVMGGGEHGAGFSLPERIKLGWLNDGADGAGRHVVEVASTGSPVASEVTFDTLAQDVEAFKGVVVPTTDGDYWIEARRDADLGPALRTGVILHFSGKHLKNHRMIDGTPETPSNTLTDGALPIGRTFADPARGIYITARSETDTSATIEVQRDPVDASPPVITAVTAVNCRFSPASCPGVPTPPGLLDWWRYATTASDADGDPLSYSWRFGIGTNGVANGISYDHGAVVFRLRPRGATPERVFVTVSDRKGREASSFVNESGYRSSWVGPSLASVELKAIPGDPSNTRSENELRFETTADPTGTELLDYAWTINGTTTAWQNPVVAPAVFALPDATAPSCIDATLRVTDTTNCSAEPVACTKAKTTCVPVPLRLSWVAVPGTGGLPGSFTITLSADMLALYPNGATPEITWSKSTDSCVLAVDASNLSATMDAPGCKVTVKLHTNNRTYVVSAVPN